MAELRRVHTFLFMILTLRFSAAEKHLYISVREGDDVTLSCENEIDDDGKCLLTDWMFRDAQAPVIDLVKSGQVDKTMISRSRSDRLRVTEKCSLAINKVTDEDVGYYGCRQQDRDSVVDVSVVTITEQTTHHTVTLSCFVRTNEICRHTVKWLLQGQEVDKDNRDVTTSQSSCFTTVSFPDTHFIYSSRFSAFKCKVTQLDGNKQQFSFRPQSSGDDTETATTKPTTTMELTDSDKLKGWQWGLVAVIVILVVIITTVVLMKLRKRKRPQRNENMVHPEEGLSYASVSFTKTSSSTAKVQNNNKGDVTYSAVKASSAAGASSDPSDPSNLYATIRE